MKRVLVGGVFDRFHEGHRHFLSAAKNLGDELIVVVTNDKNAGHKGKIQGQDERAEAVRESRLANLVVIGDEKNFMKVVNDFRPEIIALGYDQKLPVPAEGLGAEVIKIESKIEGISSSKIRGGKWA